MKIQQAATAVIYRLHSEISVGEAGVAGVLLYNKHLFSKKTAVTEARRQRKLCHGIRCRFDHGAVHLSNYMLIGCHFPRFGTFFELQLHKGQVSQQDTWM